jgi:metal-responsive CopG/Arc/MetJ family transcriptional regulator
MKTMKRFTVDLLEELHRQLKIYCAENGLKMADVIRKLVEDFLKEQKKLKK